MHHTILLYSHVSMFPTQPLHHRPQVDGPALASSATAILDLAAVVLNPSLPSFRPERRSLVFPLFITGIALALTRTPLPPSRQRQAGNGSGSGSLTGPQQAVDFLRILERESVGRNTSATRQLLERVLQACDEVTRGRGEDAAPTPVAVDWFAFADSLGVEVIHFGL